MSLGKYRMVSMPDKIGALDALQKRQKSFGGGSRSENFVRSFIREYHIRRESPCRMERVRARKEREARCAGISALIDGQYLGTAPRPEKRHLPARPIHSIQDFRPQTARYS